MKVADVTGVAWQQMCVSSWQGLGCLANKGLASRVWCVVCRMPPSPSECLCPFVSQTADIFVHRWNRLQKKRQASSKRPSREIEMRNSELLSPPWPLPTAGFGKGLFSSHASPTGKQWKL